MASIIQIGKKWRAQIRRRGAKPITKTFGTKAEASAWARKTESLIETGEYAPSSSISVGQVIDKYREMREASKREILDTSSEHYQLLTLSHHLGEIPLDRLEVDTLVTFAQTRRAEGAGPYTVNMDISKLGTVLRHMAALLKFRCFDVVGAARPVLHYLGLIGGGGKRTRRPTEDEIERIKHYCRERGETSPVYAAMPDMIDVAIQTGIRRSELTRMTWADLDETKRLILIRQRKDPRNKKINDQWVPLVGSSFDIIMRQPREDKRIFPHHPQTFSKYFKEACTALDIPDLHLHDMRHEAASTLIEAGWVPHEAMVVTGHKSSKHFDRYVNLDPAKIAEKPVKRRTSPGSDQDT